MKTVKHHEQVFNYGFCLIEKNQKKNLMWKQHSTSCMQAVYTHAHSFTPTARSTLQPHHTPSMYHTLHVCHTHPPHAPSTPPSNSACNYLLFCFLHRMNYDLLGEPSTVDPTLLHPAERLHWSISSETAKDIDIAKKNLDKCVRVLASFQDSHHQESLGKRLYVCIVW